MTQFYCSILLIFCTVSKEGEVVIFSADDSRILSLMVMGCMKVKR